MLPFPELNQVFLLPGPMGDLEIATTPAKASPVPNNVVAVVCHPHPLFGGTMNNKVVTTLVRTFSEMGMATVRFNFRGVGNSAGVFAQGVGEQDDLLAVLAWLRLAKPLSGILLAGFSFGAGIAAHVAATMQVNQLVTVAPPVPRFNLENLPAISSPWLIVQGEEDDVVIPDDVYQWAAARVPAPKLIRIANAGHFFHGQLLVLREKIQAALAPQTS
jgi:alpha/beta superfamily hydrolase